MLKLAERVNTILRKIREAYNCNHTVGVYWDHSETDLVSVSNITEEKKKRFSLYWVGDIDWFDYCPDCGERLPYKEKYKDAFEVVQMPS